MAADQLIPPNGWAGLQRVAARPTCTHIATHTGEVTMARRTTPAPDETTKVEPVEPDPTPAVDEQPTPPAEPTPDVVVTIAPDGRKYVTNRAEATRLNRTRGYKIKN